MIHEFTKPIPVVVKNEHGNDKEGYAIYVSDSGHFQNDIWCVVVNDGGIVRHFTSKQIRVQKNATIGITK